MVISSNPDNGVVYLAVIFSLHDFPSRTRRGGPSVAQFYVIQILCSSPPLAPADDACPLRASVVFDLKGGNFTYTRASYRLRLFSGVSSRKCARKMMGT